ncbi:Uncharacterised protein [Burkholderia pseudomallei]|nr:Uncharacterised protein [Burkholderia pseudomallei]
MIDASSMLGNFLQSMPGFENLINAVAALLGLLFTGFGVFRLIEYSKETGRITLWSIFACFAAAIGLFNFASSVDSFLQTLWGSGTSVHSLLAYSASSSMPAQTGVALQALIAVFRMMGYWYYISGWVRFKDVGSGHGGRDVTFKSAAIRLVGGVFLINIVATVNAVSSTFGFGDVL